MSKCTPQNNQIKTTVLTGENIIILSSDDWSSGLKTSKYHVARTLARHNQVFFVNSVGLRSPEASAGDVKRMWDKLRSFLQGASRVPEGLCVYSPILFPFMRDAAPVRQVNGVLLRSALRYYQHSLSLSTPYVLSFAPAFNAVLGHLDEKAVCYYCIDDLTGYEGVERSAFLEKERELVEKSDCVVCSSGELVDRFRDRKKTHYVPHGVCWQMFRRAVNEELPLPEDLRDIPEPRLGFYGFLSDEWVDYELLHEIARRKPEWQIVLIGKPRSGMDMSELVSPANIHYLGLKPFECLPAYTRHFSVGLVPFCRNELTASCNPLKLLEYLSGGLPVVSTDISEVHRFEQLVDIANSAEHYISLCAEAISEDDPTKRRRRSDAVKKHSWEDRVDQLSDILLQYQKS